MAASSWFSNHIPALPHLSWRSRDASREKPSLDVSHALRSEIAVRGRACPMLYGGTSRCCRWRVVLLHLGVPVITSAAASLVRSTSLIDSAYACLFDWIRPPENEAHPDP